MYDIYEQVHTLTHTCRFVANPIKMYGYSGMGRTALMLLKNRILPAILLRRTKVGKVYGMQVDTLDICLLACLPDIAEPGHLNSMCVWGVTTRVPQGAYC